MKCLCALAWHAWDKGVQDEPTEVDKQMMIAVMKHQHINSIIWSVGKWTYTCKRCGATRRD